MTPGPTGGVHVSRNKNPLSEWEIEGRAFSAKMIPPNDKASGFVYFQTGSRGGATVVLSGLRDAKSGEELFFFEVPLAGMTAQLSRARELLCVTPATSRC